LLEAVTNALQVFNMSATMARQGVRVQLEQSDMRLAWNMAKVATGRLFVRRNGGNKVSH
jgi:hypothetical protein